MTPLWPKLRALLITVALLIGGVDAIPYTAPKQLQKLPAALQPAIQRLETTRAAVMARVGFLGRWFRVQQRWQLFPSADEERNRMWIEAQADGDPEYRVLYRPHDDAHALFASELEYRRVRGNWNPRRRGARAGYDEFVSWVARRIFLSDQRFRRVRVRMEKVLVLPRGGGISGTGTFAHERVRVREDVLR